MAPTAATAERITVAELRAGGEVEGVFACSRKDRLVTKGGSPYLAVELRDRTGAIGARAFRDPDFLSGQFDRGDLVRVPGRVERFRADFRRAPCTRGGHHAYLGGLLEHTVAVATLAHEACALHTRLDSDVLIAAALLHDVGKTREFEF